MTEYRSLKYGIKWYSSDFSKICTFLAITYFKLGRSIYLHLISCSQFIVSSNLARVSFTLSESVAMNTLVAGLIIVFTILKVFLEVKPALMENFMTQSANNNRIRYSNAYILVIRIHEMLNVIIFSIFFFY